MAQADGSTENSQLVDDKPGSACCRAVTVEPAAFLYCLGYFLSVTVTQQYVSYGVAEALGADTTLTRTSLCELTANMTTTVEQVEVQAASVLSVFSLVNILPMLFAAILMGSYSDGHGRKVALIAPVVGGLIRSTWILATAGWRFNLHFLYIAGLTEGLLGGPIVFNLAAYSYIADVSGTSGRSWRMLVLMITQTLATGLAEISAGYFIAQWGFLLPLLLINAIYFLCLVNTLCFVRETIDNVRDRVRYISLTHFVRTFRPLCQHENLPRRTIVRACTLLFLLYFIVRDIMTQTLFLYVANDPMCFSWVLVGYLLAVAFTVQSLGGTLAYVALNKTLRDTGLLLLATASGIVAKFWLSVPVHNVVYVFMMPVVGVFNILIDPMTRAIISTSIPAEQQGAVQGMLAVCDVIGKLVGSVTATYIYALSVAVYSGLNFVLSGVLMVLIFIISVFVHVKKRSKPDTDTEDLSPAT